MDRQANGGPLPADVLVIFGITGDLARVMTYRSLYRLEGRGLLDCPIVGVAFDDWSLEQLVQRAREAIVATEGSVDDEVFGRLVRLDLGFWTTLAGRVPKLHKLGAYVRGGDFMLIGDQTPIRGQLQVGSDLVCRARRA